jgi:P22_AR N-terminal domain
METQQLKFNGKKLGFVFANGQYWVALRPLCDALEVNYNRQFQNLKEDRILGQLFAEQQTTGADGKRYKMICLPEKFIYGWLFFVRSESEVLYEYKLKCYEILFNYFHGKLQQRISVLMEKTEADRELMEAEEEWKNSPQYKKIQELKKKKKTSDA